MRASIALVTFLFPPPRRNLVRMAPPRRAPAAKGSSPTTTATKRSLSAAQQSPPPASKTTKKLKPITPETTKLSSSTLSERHFLFSLRDDDEELVAVTLIRRPSARNKSPYVADATLLSENRTVLVHVPNLDMGGKCVPGSHLLVRPARDKNGVKLGPNAVNPKFQTPKCEFSAQLLRVDESAYHPLYAPTWVGAQPTLGERIALHWLDQGILPLPPIDKVQRQATMGNHRFDFLVTHSDGTLRVVEVKTVVDTDYNQDAPPPESVKCRYLSSNPPSYRTAIFPWGQSKQKHQGQTVLSARAVQHVESLTNLVGKGEFAATVLMVVIRGDAQAFRPNSDACPVFAQSLYAASRAGVQVLAKKVMWGEGEGELGHCYCDGSLLPIMWPN